MQNRVHNDKQLLRNNKQY